MGLRVDHNLRYGGDSWTQAQAGFPVHRNEVCSTSAGTGATRTRAYSLDVNFQDVVCGSRWVCRRTPGYPFYLSHGHFPYHSDTTHTSIQWGISSGTYDLTFGMPNDPDDSLPGELPP